MIYGSFLWTNYSSYPFGLGSSRNMCGLSLFSANGYLSKKKKTYNWVIFLQTHFLFVNSLGFIGKGSIRKRQAKKKKKNMFDVCLQAQLMRHELITWCRLWPLREVEEKRGSKSMGFEPTFGIEENYVSWAQLWRILGNKPNSVCCFYFYFL